MEIKYIGVMAAIIIVILPIGWFFMRNFFLDMKNDVIEIKEDTKKILDIVIGHEGRISCIEGFNRGQNTQTVSEDRRKLK